MIRFRKPVSTFRDHACALAVCVALHCPRPQAVMTCGDRRMTGGPARTRAEGTMTDVRLNRSKRDGPGRAQPPLTKPRLTAASARPGGLDRCRRRPGTPRI